MSSVDPEAFWSARYHGVGEDYLFGTDPNHFLASQASLFKEGGRVLSLADGEGRNSVWLAERGMEVVASEISPVALEKARRLAEVRGVQVDFCQQDMSAPDWPPAEFTEAFDYIVAIFIQFLGSAERADLFRALEKVLRPGGCLLIQGYGIDQLKHGTGGPSSPEQLYSIPLLQESFSRWEFLHLREYECVLEEGSAHRGMSALVEAVLRRPV
ncbi:MAG: SAM-dependent methyltransferase [Azovibrio sp.]